MAESSDDAGRAVLAEVLQTTSRGCDPWRRAAGGLMALGDASARRLLEGELAQPDATRSVGAAELLARAGDDEARELLARDAADPEFARQGDAAAALARLGDERALGWVAGGLVSAEGDERKLALSICGRLAAGATTHALTIAKLATDDPDLRVRMIAEAVLLGMGGSR
jgi:HEAT repeat protein